MVQIADCDYQKVVCSISVGSLCLDSANKLIVIDNRYYGMVGFIGNYFQEQLA